MKALSIWQPWASLIADGHKRFETRSWETSYRGPVLICASKKLMSWEEREEIKPIQWHVGWIRSAYFRTVAEQPMSERWDPGYDNLPFGAAICIANLQEIFRTEDPQLLKCFIDAKELALGEFYPGRFAWDLQNIRKFVNPWPVIGRQGLFNVPDEEIEKHELEEIQE